MEQNQNFRESRKKKRNRLTVSILMVLLLFALFVVQCELSKMKDEVQDAQKSDETLAPKIPERQDTIAIRDTVPEPREEATDTVPKTRRETVKRRNDPKPNKDSLEHAKRAILDSIQKADSLRKADSIAYANRDSIT